MTEALTKERGDAVSGCLDLLLGTAIVRPREHTPCLASSHYRQPLSGLAEELGAFEHAIVKVSALPIFPSSYSQSTQTRDDAFLPPSDSSGSRGSHI